MDVELAEQVAIGCRILAREGLSRAAFGHVSARAQDGSILIKGKGPNEEGLQFTSRRDIVAMTADGDILESSNGLTIPGEAPIHVALLDRRPDVGAVVHAHPRTVVALLAAGRELLPLYGSYDPSGLQLAAGGLARYPKSTLIHSSELGAELAEEMGMATACVMDGHGIVTVGANVQEAVCAAVALGELALVNWMSAAVGTPQPIADDEIAFFATFMQRPSTRERLGSRRDTHDLPMWHYLMRRLDDTGRADFAPFA